VDVIGEWEVWEEIRHSRPVVKVFDAGGEDALVGGHALETRARVEYISHS
jgi:hypothetical protein